MHCDISRITKKIKLDKVELVMCFIQINDGKKEENTSDCISRTFSLSHQTRQKYFLAPEIYI